jgi:hypothetical protein
MSMKWLSLVRLTMAAAALLALNHASLAQTQQAASSGGGSDNCETELVLVADASSSASEPGGEAGDVQERAVPRLAPGMAPGAASPGSQVEGGIFEGKRLKAKPGYHFEQQQGGVAMLRPNSGGAGVKLSCRCMKGKGACIMTIESGTSAYCSSNGCAGDCEMRLTTGLMSPGLRIQ